MPAPRPIVDFCSVLRPFNAEGRELERGEIVDVTSWRNPTPLVNTHYLALIHSEVASVENKCACSRSFVTDDTLRAHRALVHPEGTLRRTRKVTA